MVRRPAFDRDAVVERAMEVFWREGYQGASVAALGSAMGLLPGSLYAAFGSKEGLFREVLGFYVARIRARAAASGLRGRALIEAWFAMHIDAALGDDDSALGRGCLLLASAAEAPRLDVESAAAVRAELDALERMLVRCVTDARKELAATRGATATQTARLLVGALAGISAMSRAGAPRKTLEDIARAALSVV